MPSIVPEHVCRGRRWYRRRYSAGTCSTERITTVVIHRCHRCSVSADKRRRGVRRVLKLVLVLLLLLLLLQELVLEVLVLWSFFAGSGQVQFDERSEPPLGKICNGSEPTRIILDAIPSSSSVTDATLHRGETRTPVLGQRLPSVKLSMVLVETPFREATRRITAGTSATFSRPCHATSTGTSTIILTTLGATERVEETAGLVLGTAAG